jgi:hypothetical protein
MNKCAAPEPHAHNHDDVCIWGRHRMHCICSAHRRAHDAVTEVTRTTPKLRRHVRQGAPRTSTGVRPCARLPLALTSSTTPSSSLPPPCGAAHARCLHSTHGRHNVNVLAVLAPIPHAPPHHMLGSTPAVVGALSIGDVHFCAPLSRN